MVKQLLIVALFVTCMVNAQTPEEFKQIVNSEMNRTQAEMEFQQNPNTAGYDLKFHRLAFNLDPAEYYVDGVVTTYFEAENNLSSITFDFTDQLTVSSVTRNGTSLSFVQNANDELVIDFPEVIAAGALDSLTISYAGIPAADQAAFTATTHNNAPIIYTLSEPYGSKDWWPCKQDLNDKVDSIEVKITTPAQYVAVSNGLETGNVINGDLKTTTFQHKHPIPAYLIAIAVTNYEVYSHTVGEGEEAFDIVNYIYPESLETAQAATPATVEIMELYQDLFEVYPFADEKYGHAQFSWGGGMEHTTVSFMGGFSRGLIAHELAHQWFGDKVTCGSWRDIWLNEGFATYLAGLVEEHLDGNADFINWKQTKIANITSNIGGSVYLTAADTTNVNRIFSSRLSYNKPSMVIHMLRKKVGDENFYAALQAYLADPELAYDYAHTPDIIAHLEAQSGLDLTEFFEDWIYGQGYPTYTIDWNQADENNINLTIHQATSMPTSVDFFEMSLPFRFIGENGQVVDLVVENTSNDQNFVLPVDFTVEQVQFDPEYDLISKNNTVTLKVDKVALQESDLEIYPNPGNTTFSIKKPNHLSINNIKVYDLSGKLVSEIDEVVDVDVSELETGVHKVIIETDLGVVQKSFLKK